MNVVKIIHDFDFYLNTTLNNALGTSWNYAVELNRYENTVEIILTDSREGSIISAYALDQTPESEQIIRAIEKEFIGYLTRTIINIKRETIIISYEYDSVVINFKLN